MDIYNSPIMMQTKAPCIFAAGACPSNRWLASREAAERRACEGRFYETQPRLSAEAKARLAASYDASFPGGDGEGAGARLTAVLQTWSGGNYLGAVELARSYAARAAELRIEEVIYLWNGPGPLPEAAVAALAELPPVRVVRAPSNSLLNRYNATLLAPLRTAAVAFSDDDVALERPDLLLDAWRRFGGRRIVGVHPRVFDASDGKLTYTTQSQSYAFDLGGSGSSPAAAPPPALRQADMVLPSGMVVHRALLEAFTTGAAAVLHDFIEVHCVHPDDIALNLFAQLLTRRAAVVVPKELVLAPSAHRSSRASMVAERLRRRWDSLFLGRKEQMGMSRRGSQWWNERRSSALQWIVAHLGGRVQQGSYVELR